MAPITLRREGQISELRAYDVRLFMKFGGADYILGIQVPDWWWDEMKPLCPKPLDQGTDYATGVSRLPWQQSHTGSSTYIGNRRSGTINFTPKPRYK